MKRRILFVDDEHRVLDGLRRMLREQRTRWEMNFVDSVDEALDCVRETDFDAVVTDVMMPGKDGFHLLSALRNADRGSDIPVVMLTGAGDTDLKRRALDRGATDLLNKPIAQEDLIARLHNVLRLKSYQDELKRHNQVLEARVEKRTAELAASRLNMIWRLGKAAEYRDEETGNHVVRVAHYCRVLSEAMGLGSEFRQTLFLASPLHDIGKIGIPDTILLKAGRLTDEERRTMQRHCVIGADILRTDPRSERNLHAWQLNRSDGHEPAPDDPVLILASSIALSHHERWDGAGYPSGWAGERIPLEARIVALADVYDALRSERPYKPAYCEARVLEIIDGEASRHFDPKVHSAFTTCVDDFRSIQTEVGDGSAELENSGRTI